MSQNNSLFLHEAIIFINLYCMLLKDTLASQKNIVIWNSLSISNSLSELITFEQQRA